MDLTAIRLVKWWAVLDSLHSYAVKKAECNCEADTSSASAACGTGKPKNP